MARQTSPTEEDNLPLMRATDQTSSNDAGSPEDLVATNDFYCNEVLNGHTSVRIVIETEHVLAFHHTRPSYPVHIVVIPKRHIGSLIDLEPTDDALLLDLLHVVKQVAFQIVQDHGACRVITNLGDYQDSKHLHWHVISATPRQSP